MPNHEIVAIYDDVTERERNAEKIKESEVASKLAHRIRHVIGQLRGDAPTPTADGLGKDANSVAEYIMAALLHLGKQQGFPLSGKTIGIIGVGNIGKLVKQKAEALGMHPILNDPLLAETGQIDHRSLEETLGCDVVTLHTPLTTNGPYPTYHLLNEQTVKCPK